MIWTIAQREIQEHLKSIRVIAIMVLVVVVVPLTVVVNSRAYQQRLDNYQRVSAGERGGVYYSTQGMGGGRPAYRRPSELSVIVAGADAAMPGYWSFTPSGLQDGPPAAPARGLVAVAGEIDLLFVVRVVVGLLAFLLAFDVVSGERESGTLKAVLSHPVPRARLLLGKIAGGGLALAAALVLAFLLAAITLRLVHVSPFASRTLVAVVLLFAASCFYAVAFFVVGVLVSSLTASSRTALVALLVVWVAFVLVIPRLATVLAQAVRPVESDQVVGIRIREASKPFQDEESRKTEELWIRLTGQPSGQIKVQEVPAEVMTQYNEQSGAVIEEINRRRRDVVNGILRDHERKLDRQQALANALARFSPSAALDFAAADLAGTGDGTRQEWVRQLEVKQHLLEGQLFDQHFGTVIHSGRTSSMYGGSYLPGSRAVPNDSMLTRFVFQPPGIARVVVETAPNFLVLIGYIGGAMLLAFGAFLRYDVR